MSNEPTNDPTDEDQMSTADAIPAPDGAALPAAPAAPATPAADPPPAANTAAATAEAAADAAATTATTETTTTATAAATATLPAASMAVGKEDRSRLSALVLGRRLVTMAITVALLAGGVYAGWQYYNATQPAPVAPGDPAVVGVPTPPIVSELASAIGSDDANAIRVTLNAEMFSRYTADMERFGIQSIDGVTTLGTFTDGPRTATALVILGRSADRNPFTINLVVIAQDGQIVRLR